MRRRFYPGDKGVGESLSATECAALQAGAHDADAQGVSSIAHDSGILRAMTTNGDKVSETEKVRGPIEPGLAADLIAVEGNPLENIDALRQVTFVMKSVGQNLTARLATTAFSQAKLNTWSTSAPP